MRVVVKLPLERLPVVPDQPLGDTEHDEAFDDVQEIVAAVLYAILTGPFEPLALISAVGGVGLETTTS